MSITLKDIAHRANVTSATVSMVINNKPNISQTTRDRVLKIAEELNYYPNAIARGLATRKTNAIGVIVPNLASSYVVRILQGIKSTNRDIDYTVQLFDTIGQNVTEYQLFQRLARERRIDGAILVGPICSEEEINMFKNESIPCISVARKIGDLDSVFANNREGAKVATEYLIKTGHGIIATVICKKKGLPMTDRIAGYQDSLDEHNISYCKELVFEVADDKMSDGSKIFKKIMNLSQRPTAIFVPAGDMVAIGIIKQAKKYGLSIPNDLAVVGFDDLPAAEVVEPSLTTVRQPKLEMGDYAIGIIIDKIEGRLNKIEQKELHTKFIIRESA